jgi:alanine dehydrogenase
MNIGIPKESRPSEYRVGLSPSGVRRLTRRGNTCYVEHNAGKAAGFSDQDYENVGASIVYSAHEAFARADFIAKITRPVEEEMALIRPRSILGGFLHLSAASQTKIDYLLENEITTIPYEMIQREDGSRPVMKQMTQVGGKLIPQIASHLLQNNTGGKGILLSGIAGVPPAEVVIIGAGLLGLSTIKAFASVGANITVLDISTEALQNAINLAPRITTMYATRANLELSCSYADVVITTAGVPGERSPVLITREMLMKMKPRTVIVDAAIDQGGCLETSRPTTHDNPTFIEEDVIHYCVPNISSIAARTATNTISNVIFPYILEIADKGLESALEKNPEIGAALATHKGEIHNLKRLTDAKV